MSVSFEKIVVLDFEATCKPGGAPVPQEIIEFPSVLVSLDDGRSIDEFSTFVRPVHHPQLSEFCTELTSIRQTDVDGAPTFAEVLAQHRQWLASHGLLEPTEDGRDRFAFVTCGDWDLAAMLPVQCKASNIPIDTLPPAYRRWINIKQVFSSRRTKVKSLGMPSMLAALGLSLEGTHHRGIDDCRNIARIALALKGLGASFEITSRLSPSHYPPLPVRLRWRDRSESAVLTKRSLPALLGLASGVFRTQMLAARTTDGLFVTDEVLCELPADVALDLHAALDGPGAKN